MLLEAILAIAIVSVSLTLIAQGLLTNYRTGMRFQEMVRALNAMDNRLGLLYATQGSDDLLEAFPQPLESPYDKFTVSAKTGPINDHLKNVTLTLNWPMGNSQGQLELETIIYYPNETTSSS